MISTQPQKIKTSKTGTKIKNERERKELRSQILAKNPLYVQIESQPEKKNRKKKSKKINKIEEQVKKILKNFNSKYITEKNKNNQSQ